MQPFFNRGRQRRHRTRNRHDRNLAQESNDPSDTNHDAVHELLHIYPSENIHPTFITQLRQQVQRTITPNPPPRLIENPTHRTCPPHAHEHQ